ncbi:ferric reductase like transmembrane component-domain-containing protein [Annulohypoxylon truncatum]|uniref:ferric reductase like transmembrane component-domain-containing protein n=1 Tax=Annulohypoxylon truncatum TaxID=327061 RepID=UPI0020089DF2|nr:ferric reductase like transmembrane component-domain-containing protein [Annulohypoxylon truncatum]KAI1213756.1 ferric reductase like transmembrane component-domain-containing protein [Annulohypoxylon truncatum]
MMLVDGVDRDWALEIFRESLRTSRSSLDNDISILSGGIPGRKIPTDPESLQYLRELITSILDGRTIVFAYNIVLLAILISFALFHLRERIREKSRWRIIEQDSAAASENPRKTSDGSEIVNESEAESSSSSTLEGSLSSHILLKVADEDVERQPLLRTQRKSHLGNSRIHWLNGLRSLLLYQPRPVPIINRTLPSNGTSLSVLAFLGLNVFYHFYKLPLELRFFFAFADRAGIIFIVNLPLLYLLAAKNQPLKLLTGHSYEALNIYHRRVGELLCFEAFVHFAGMLVWRIWLSPSWLATDSFYSYITHPLILLGIGAFISYELLYFTSLGSFRERWYEIFLASHVVLQIAALAFLWLHFHTSRPYVFASLVIFLVDRLFWRLWMKSDTFTADVTILDDEQTLLLSADWHIPSSRSRTCRGPFRQSIRHGWKPADHVFISVPVLGRSHSLQAHPFTIASAAPVADYERSSNHAWLGLLIRVQSGFTSGLLDYARMNSRVAVRLDGPYGSQDPLNMLRSCENAVLIAGGSGIAVVFPMAWSLATSHHGKRQLHLIWVIHSQAQRSWIPEERITELRSFGVHITIPEPTSEAGRPDIPGHIADLVATSEGRVGFVISGPDGLNRTSRNACAEAVKSGADIQLRVEKFGW